MPSVTDKDYTPGQSGSPTGAEKDILVCPIIFFPKILHNTNHVVILTLKPNHFFD